MESAVATVQASAGLIDVIAAIDESASRSASMRPLPSAAPLAVSARTLHRSPFQSRTFSGREAPPLREASLPPARTIRPATNVCRDDARRTILATNLGTLELTWCGHATFAIKTPAGKHVIVDPFLEQNPACPDKLKRPAA